MAKRTLNLFATDTEELLNKCSEYLDAIKSRGKDIYDAIFLGDEKVGEISYNPYNEVDCFIAKLSDNGGFEDMPFDEYSLAEFGGATYTIKKETF